MFALSLSKDGGKQHLCFVYYNDLICVNLYTFYTDIIFLPWGLSEF